MAKDNKDRTDQAINLIDSLLAILSPKDLKSKEAKRASTQKADGGGGETKESAAQVASKKDKDKVATQKDFLQKLGTFIHGFRDEDGLSDWLLYLKSILLPSFIALPEEDIMRFVRFFVDRNQEIILQQLRQMGVYSINFQDKNLIAEILASEKSEGSVGFEAMFVTTLLDFVSKEELAEQAGGAGGEEKEEETTASLANIFSGNFQETLRNFGKTTIGIEVGSKSKTRIEIPLNLTQMIAQTGKILVKGKGIGIKKYWGTFAKKLLASPLGLGLTRLALNRGLKDMHKNDKEDNLKILISFLEYIKLILEGNSRGFEPYIWLLVKRKFLLDKLNKFFVDIHDADKIEKEGFKKIKDSLVGDISHCNIAQECSEELTKWLDEEPRDEAKFIGSFVEEVKFMDDKPDSCDEIFVDAVPVVDSNPTPEAKRSRISWDIFRRFGFINLFTIALSTLWAFDPLGVASPFAIKLLPIFIGLLISFGWDLIFELNSGEEDLLTLKMTKIKVAILLLLILAMLVLTVCANLLVGMSMFTQFGILVGVGICAWLLFSLPKSWIIESSEKIFGILRRNIKSVYSLLLATVIISMSIGFYSVSKIIPVECEVLLLVLAVTTLIINIWETTQNKQFNLKLTALLVGSIPSLLAITVVALKLSGSLTINSPSDYLVAVVFISSTFVVFSFALSVLFSQNLGDFQKAVSSQSESRKPQAARESREQKRESCFSPPPPTFTLKSLASN